MELVAAAKMRKAQAQTLATRQYANYAWKLIQNLSANSDPKLHRLLRVPNRNDRALLVVMSSNRGLIGGFNNHLIQTAVKYADQFKAVDVVSLGKKGRDGLRKAGLAIVADFEKKDTSGSVAEINSLAKLASEDFIAGKYDKVTLVYMKFVSTLVQKPEVLELLPLHVPDRAVRTQIPNGDLLFEPTVDEVLEQVLPKLTVMQIYQALLETNAAEHSARMVAMKNASDSAADLIDDLTLEFNQIRQAGITKEISEIVSGKLALNQN